MRDRLIELVGAEGLREGTGAARWSVHGVAPRAVVVPATAEEAAAVLALATAEGWAVELAGAGGGLESGRPPERLDLVVATGRLTGVHFHEPADLVASVGAGLTVGALADRLAPHRQWLPLDPPGAGASTLGGVVATASAGPLRQGHGTPRDHLLGLQLVTGDGRVLELGGRVVKNVAGYDLVRLVTGSRGTLGLITRVNVRLRALPERDRTLALVSPEPGPLLDVVQAMRAARLEPVALELVSEPDPPGTVHPTDGPWRLLVRFQANAEAVEQATAHLGRLAGGLRLEALPENEAARCWEALDRLETTAGLIVRLADRPAELPETIALARRLPAIGQRPAIAAHAGGGIVRILVPAGETVGRDSGPWSAALAEARTALAERRGTLVVARGPRALLERLDPWGDVGPAIRLMRGLKKEFDPAGILGPGRFVL